MTLPWPTNAKRPSRFGESLVREGRLYSPPLATLGQATVPDRAAFGTVLRSDRWSHRARASRDSEDVQSGVSPRAQRRRRTARTSQVRSRGRRLPI